MNSDLKLKMCNDTRIWDIFMVQAEAMSSFITKNLPIIWNYHSFSPQLGHNPTPLLHHTRYMQFFANE